MRNLLFGGLAVVGGVYLGKIAAKYVLKRYKEDIREYLINQTIDYIFTDENGKELDNDELVMKAINAYLKKKGAK